MEAQRRWGLSPRQIAGQGQCWARCCGPRARRGASGWPLPHHPAWPLAVNTERTSSVSREIFISGRVGSVRWPPPVLPAGWPGAGGEGAWWPWGAICGAPRRLSQEGCALRLPPELESECRLRGERRQLIGEKPPHNLASVAFLFSSLSTRLRWFLPLSLCFCLLPPPGMLFLPLPCMPQLSAGFLWEVFPDSLTP